MSDMPSMPTGTAVVSWQDSGGLHIRVSSSDGYKVIERCIDSGTSGWTNGGFSAAGNNVSATCWQDSAGVHIRVYCTFEDKTTEYCCDPGSGWTQGSYTTT